jgi:hypothetical protein
MWRGFFLFLAVLGGLGSLRAQLPVEPLQGYVYVDPFEVRKEFALRLTAYPDWQARAGEVLDAAAQAGVLRDLGAQLAEACPLLLDGATPVLEPVLIRFVQVVPELGVVKDERTEIPVGEAMVAAVFSASTKGYPDEITWRWNLYPDPGMNVPAHFVAAQGRGSYVFTQNAREHTWLVPKGEAPGLVPVPVPVDVALAPRWRLPVASLALLGVAVVAGISGRFLRGGAQVAAGIVAGLGLVGSLAAWGWRGVAVREPGSAVPRVAEEDAAEVTHALIKNIYHAFEFRDEERIYDVLSATVDGPLLEKVYLDVLRGLQIEEDGGPRTKVTHLDLRRTHAEELDGREGFRCDAEWVAVGNVVHWGHSHTRLNKYHAWLTVEPVDGTWKVTDVEIVEEGRL